MIAEGTIARPYQSPFVDVPPSEGYLTKPEGITLSPDQHFFPHDRAFAPLLAHPDVSAAPPAIRTRLLIHYLYMHLLFTIELERKQVARACELLANKHFLPNAFSPRMRIDARRILTEEKIHAVMCKALLKATQQYTEEAPIPKQSAFTEAMAGLRRDVRRENRCPEFQQLVDIFIVIITETLMTGTLTNLHEITDVQPAVRKVISDHAQDEARHFEYFRQLAPLMWEAVPEGLRRRLGKLLPQVITSYLLPDRGMLKAMLGKFPDYFSNPEKIIEETLDETSIIASVRSSAVSTLGLFINIGMMEDGEVEKAFQNAHLLD